MNLFEIFKNLDYKVVADQHFGEVVVMTAEEAFDFSAIVGSNYLLGMYGISMKGRNEVFIHRNIFHGGAYIYSPGLFGRDRNRFICEENSGESLLKRYPSIFSGNKKIAIYNLKKNQRSNVDSEVIKEILAANGNPEEYLLFKFTEKENYIEPFIEWIASRHFIEKGYLFENQCPFFQQSFDYKGIKLTGGIPDVSAMKSSEFNILSKYNIISPTKGLIINKLPVLINFNLIKKTPNHHYETGYELVIGEVKCNAGGLSQAIKQLEKYESVQLANKMYSLIPDCKENGSSKFGSGYIDNNKFILKEKALLTFDSGHQIDDSKWLSTYIKINLLAALPISVIKENLSIRFKLQDFYSHHLIDYALSLDLEELLEKIIGHYGIH
jgi:hypothetical protein